MTGHTVVVLIIGVSIAIRIAIIMIIIFYDYPQFYIYLNDVRKSCYLLSWAGDRRNKDKEDFIPTLQFQINGNISRLQLASLKVCLQKLNIFNFRDLY